MLQLISHILPSPDLIVSSRYPCPQSSFGSARFNSRAEFVGPQDMQTGSQAEEQTPKAIKSGRGRRQLRFHAWPQLLKDGLGGRTDGRLASLSALTKLFSFQLDMYNLS